MNRKILVHIGMHKTASSYMQQHLFPNLQDTMYLYGAKSLISQWNRQVGLDNNRLFISHESFSGSPWNKKWLLGIANNHKWLTSFTKNLENLRFFFPEAVVIIFFRKHGDLLISLYKQYIQERGTLIFSEFYGHNKLIEPKDLSFKYRIDLLNKFFTNVYFLDFEEFKKRGDSYLKLFFQNEFNINLNISGNEKLANNRGVTGGKLEILRKINKYYNFLPSKVKNGIDILGVTPRSIMQTKTKFWEPKSLEKNSIIKEKINTKFNKDWDYFCSFKYIHNI